MLVLSEIMCRGIGGREEKEKKNVLTRLGTHTGKVQVATALFIMSRRGRLVRACAHKKGCVQIVVRAGFS